MGVLKSIISHNPIDYYSAWNRRRLTKKGIVEKRDNQIYRHVGIRFFPKILKITNQLTTYGTENIGILPSKIGFVVVSNHKYALDPFYLGAAFIHNYQITRKIAWVSKIENFIFPIQKSIITPFGTIPLGKGRKIIPLTLKMINDKINKGIGIGMFPEGTRNKSKKLQEFHAGAARIALEYKVPYIPMAILGKRIFFKGKCTVRIGRPVFINPEIECKYSYAKEIANHMHDQVQALLDGNIYDLPKCKYEVSKEEFLRLRKKMLEKELVREIPLSVKEYSSDLEEIIALEKAEEEISISK
ncbi:MAG: lysophospholipid acyltransferase family protein [Promethearchaeota archaeon]